MSRLVVLINRRARRFARDPKLAAAAASAAGREALVIDTSSLDELADAARRVHAAAPDAVALCGGDGTYSAGLTALRAAYGDAALPVVALIPGGTVSTVARNFGVAGSPLAALAALARRHAAGTLQTRRHRTLCANGRVGFIFGAALVANFFEVYYRRGGRGYADAARIVARVFVESFVGGPHARAVLDPVPCRIEADGVALSAERFSLVCCATVRDLGLHMVVNHRAGERDDALHLVASALPPRALGPQMFRVIAGRPIRGAAHHDALVRRFRVEFPEARAWVIDGDVARDQVVEVAPGPAIEVATGPF